MSFNHFWIFKPDCDKRLSSYCKCLWQAFWGGKGEWMVIGEESTCRGGLEGREMEGAWGGPEGVMFAQIGNHGLLDLNKNKSWSYNYWEKILGGRRQDRFIVFIHVYIQIEVLVPNPAEHKSYSCTDYNYSNQWDKRVLVNIKNVLKLTNYHWDK